MPLCALVCFVITRVMLMRFRRYALRYVDDARAATARCLCLPMLAVECRMPCRVRWHALSRFRATSVCALFVTAAFFFATRAMFDMIH